MRFEVCLLRPGATGHFDQAQRQGELLEFCSKGWTTHAECAVRRHRRRTLKRLRAPQRTTCWQFWRPESVRQSTVVSPAVTVAQPLFHTLFGVQAVSETLLAAFNQVCYKGLRDEVGAGACSARCDAPRRHRE